MSTSLQNLLIPGAEPTLLQDMNDTKTTTAKAPSRLLQDGQQPRMVHPQPPPQHLPQPQDLREGPIPALELRQGPIQEAVDLGLLGPRGEVDGAERVCDGVAPLLAEAKDGRGEEVLGLEELRAEGDW